MGKIFQEPMTSLSPLHTIGDQIGEVLAIHTSAGKAEIKARTQEMLGWSASRTLPAPTACIPSSSRVACASAR